MIGQKDYRRDLGSCPTGVTIVTAFYCDRQPWGLTANSFITSISLKPPVISVCIAQTGHVFPTLVASSSFVINIVAADQQDLALHFAINVENRFDGTTWQVAPNGAPLLPSAAAPQKCSVHKRIDGEDHEILLGLEESYTHNPTAPLVYCRGSFFAVPQPEVTR